LKKVPPFDLDIAEPIRSGISICAPAVGQFDVSRPQPCPQFRNDEGVREIRIGAKAFECIGETPPQDHPHIYFEMGEHSQILCPYCGTLFRFDPDLGNVDADPPGTRLRNAS